MKTTILKARNSMELGLMIEKFRETHEVISVYYLFNPIEHIPSLGTSCIARVQYK